MNRRLALSTIVSVVMSPLPRLSDGRDSSPPWMDHWHSPLLAWNSRLGIAFAQCPNEEYMYVFAKGAEHPVILVKKCLPNALANMIEFCLDIAALLKKYEEAHRLKKNKSYVSAWCTHHRIAAKYSAQG